MIKLQNLKDLDASVLALGLRRVSEGWGECFSCWFLRYDLHRHAPAFGSYDDEMQMREELAIDTNSNATNKEYDDMWVIELRKMLLKFN